MKNKSVRLSFKTLTEDGIALRKKSEKENEDIGLSTILRTVSPVSTCMLQQLPVGSVQ